MPGSENEYQFDAEEESVAEEALEEQEEKPAAAPASKPAAPSQPSSAPGSKPASAAPSRPLSAKTTSSSGSGKVSNGALLPAVGVSAAAAMAASMPAAAASRPQSAGVQNASVVLAAKNFEPLQAPPAPSAASVASARRITVPGLPVYLPEAAIHPKVAVQAPTDPGRSEDTLLITRTRRGSKELTLRGCSPTPAQMAQRDFSSYYPPPATFYSSRYLDELVYNDTMRERAKTAREREAQREAAAALAAKPAWARRSRSKDDEERRVGGVSLAFFERQEAAVKRGTDFVKEARAQRDFDAQPQKYCPVCGTQMTYSDFKQGIKRCSKDACKGAMFRPAKCWTDVEKSFFARDSQFFVRRAENLKKIDAETLPPFRMLTKKVFNKESGEMEDEPVPVHAWADVADGFFERNQEALDRIAAREKQYEAEQSKAAEKFKVKLNSNYKFSKPLPDFHARQAAVMDRKNMTFEERLDALKDL